MAGIRELFPGRGHLLELLAMRRGRGPRHFPAFGGVFTVLM